MKKLRLILFIFFASYMLFSPMYIQVFDNDVRFFRKWTMYRQRIPNTLRLEVRPIKKKELSNNEYEEQVHKTLRFSSSYRKPTSLADAYKKLGLLCKKHIKTDNQFEYYLGSPTKYGWKWIERKTKLTCSKL